MELVWVIVLILASLFALILLIVSVVAGFVLYKTLQSNFVLQNKIGEYKEFFDLTLNTLINDTIFLRSELVRKMALVPETQEMNKQIQQFESRLFTIRELMEQEKLL